MMMLSITSSGRTKALTAATRPYFVARCFSKQPSHPEKKQHGNKKTSTPSRSSGKNNSQSQSSGLNHKSTRFKNTRKKEWKSRNQHPSEVLQASAILQPSNYLYNERRRSGEANTTSPRLTLTSLDASALLDPLTFCKASAKSHQTHGVSRSISGTDAARRLLRGKKEFLTNARGLRVPVLLTGHGVPDQLFQHCIDMADALMIQCGKDVVEATFHNYNSDENKLLTYVRTRSGLDSTNSCFAWPPDQGSSSRVTVDWDYHMSLYLTVMERLARNLGLILQKKLKRQDEGDDDHNEFTSSPLLFPKNQAPHWNVDLLRGTYFDIYHRFPDSNEDMPPPMPIVEFSHASNDSQTTNGHVLIRLQGYAAPNDDFSAQHSRKPVTLVFDACFQSQ